ncbi:glycosyltransferase family 4 protein [Catellatospora vulcania]|uniref:glycosyltransferase family 4 protein n=1 Tax=Catellatospora vulcania TaxID=1460450 RepID=UPI0018AFD6C8|nr:glycosyltransferase family 4 protein [Catellatospora vulcania]
MAETRENRPARIVMLVDNGVNGDSRVQKTARSAAEAGWEVILIGRSPTGHPERWQLGDAEVRLVVMHSPMAKRRHEFRRHWLITPFAYPPTGVAAQRLQSVKAWKQDLKMKRALRKLKGKGPGLSVQVQGALAGLYGKWVSFRYWQLNIGQRYRGSLRSPWDQAYTWFQHKVRGHGAWRKLEPQLWDFELAYADTVDALKPDVIYANDFRMLGVGARAKVRAAVAGHKIKLIWDVHEYLPGVKPRANNRRWMGANRAHEHEYAPYADAVITVSAKLGELLKRDHHLPELPSVVLNTPSAADAAAKNAPGAPDIRSACGLGPDTPLVVYSGAAAAHRGMGVMVEALPRLAGVHTAFVVNDPTGPYLTSLKKRAAELGVADRLHVLPYVSHSEVVGFLSTATVGVIPIHHYLNHEIQLITKFFEYSHAGLPIISSDCEVMANTTLANKQGEVFKVEDVADYTRAVQAIVADPERYRAAYEAMDLDVWTWEAQAKVQDAIYRRLVLPHQRPATGAQEVDEPLAVPVGS